jgi:hypothetical protein
MSTRGIIAVGTIDRWRGVYNHSGSYPTWMGPELMGHLGREIVTGKTLTEIGASILKFDDWESYLAGGVCKYCGKLNGRPHSITGTVYGKDKPGFYPDKSAKHHQHLKLSDTKKNQFTEKDIAESTDIEWVYVIDPKANVVHVIDVRHDRKHVGDMNFTEEANYKVLECGAEFERCTHMAWAHFPEIDQSGPQAILSTSAYLGFRPLVDFHYAYAYEIKGKRFLRGGCGINGRYASERFSSPIIKNPKSTAWYQTVKVGDVDLGYRPVARIDKNGGYTPWPGVKWIFPPTLVNPQETVRSK